MSTTPNKLQKPFLEMGLCDERCAVFVATAGQLPDGGFGAVYLAVNGHDLNIIDCAGLKNEIGELLYTIPLRKVQKFQSANGFFGELLKGYSFRFVYGGHKYVFKNCFTMKREIGIIAQEAG